MGFKSEVFTGRKTFLSHNEQLKALKEVEYYDL